jgi:hypothetical protein
MAASWLEMASRIANSLGFRVRSKENSAKRASRYLCSRQKSSIRPVNTVSLDRLPCLAVCCSRLLRAFGSISHINITPRVSDNRIDRQRCDGLLRGSANNCRVWCMHSGSTWSDLKSSISHIRYAQLHIHLPLVSNNSA